MGSTTFARPVFLAFLTAGLPSVALAQPPASAQSAVKPFELFRAPTTTGPSVRLQLPQASTNLFTKSAVPPLPPPTVVCGMTLIPADPRLDKRMLHDTPTGPRFSMQSVEPQTCKR